MYAGTGALGGAGGSKLIDGARSAARTIQNNLLDATKQVSPQTHFYYVACCKKMKIIIFLEGKSMTTTLTRVDRASKGRILFSSTQTLHSLAESKH